MSKKDKQEPAGRSPPKAGPFYVSVRLRKDTYSRLIRAKARMMDERGENVGLSGIVDILLAEFRRGTRVAAASESGLEVMAIPQAPPSRRRSEWRRISVE